MKSKTKVIRISAIFFFATAFFVNVQSNLNGKTILFGDLAFADSGSGTETGTKKYDWRFPTCSDNRICNGESVEYMGTKLKCVNGYSYANCTDGTSCDPSTACPRSTN